MVNVPSLLIKAGSGLGFSFGIIAWTEMKNMARQVYSKGSLK